MKNMDVELLLQLKKDNQGENLQQILKNILEEVTLLKIWIGKKFIHE